MITCYNGTFYAPNVVLEFEFQIEIASFGGSPGIEPAQTNSAVKIGLFVAGSIGPCQIVKWARPELNRCQ